MLAYEDRENIKIKLPHMVMYELKGGQAQWRFVAMSI